MPTYMVGYDLNAPGKDYSDLIEAIRGYDNWWHHLDSTWIIVTNQTHIQIRDYLAQFIDENDEMLVAKLAGLAAWRGFNTRGSNWLSNNLGFPR
jgi:hypothetical protein